MASPNYFDWSLISGISDEAFGIPTDVVFQIEDSGQLHEIKAHRTILAIVSPIFKLMLYTTQVGDTAANVIKIQQTTAPAFQTIMDAIYHTKSIGDSLKGKSVKEVFDVLILVEQYQIAQIKEPFEKILSAFPVDNDTVLDVAAEAMEYITLFEMEAKHLLLNCAKFLKLKVPKTVNFISTYAEENNKKEVFSALLDLMKDMNCPNCEYKYCKDKEEVEDDEFRVGLSVGWPVHNPGNPWGWARFINPGRGKVTRVEEGNVIFVEDITSGSVEKRFKRYGWTGEPMCFFICKKL